MERAQLLKALASYIVSVERPHPIRVAIDGVDAAGKTTLADELVGPLKVYERPVIRASIDSFHNPRDTRYRRGPDSAEGYYLDSFDNEAVISYLLEPLGPGGNLEIRTAVFDHRIDSNIEQPIQCALSDAILLFDGIFLLRPQLQGYWDFTIFVDVTFEVSISRAIKRDLELEGSAETVRRRYQRRYVPGQRLYLEECRPREIADIIVDNNDWVNPAVIELRQL